MDVSKLRTLNYEHKIIKITYFLVNENNGVIFEVVSIQMKTMANSTLFLLQNLYKMLQISC